MSGSPSTLLMFSFAFSLTSSIFIFHLSFIPSALPTISRLRTARLSNQVISPLAVNGTVCRSASPGLFGPPESHHLSKVGWPGALQGRSAAHVTSSYRGDVDHGQMFGRGLEGVYGIVTKGKQFRGFKFHLQGRKNVETVVGRLPKARAPNCFH